MKYNCCQQSDLCPENKTCKPLNSPKKPWKRFTCEYQDGYHGDNCDQPMVSCQGYAQCSRKSGLYKVADTVGGPLYEVYCHFDSDGAAWTLVQSYSFANRSLDQFKKFISNNLPMSENVLTWSGYRLSKPRMKSIKNNSTFLQFTCDYEKHLAIKKSDYVQLRLQDINVDVLELRNDTSNVGAIRDVRGKIGKYDLDHCETQLRQNTDGPLHVSFKHRNLINDPTPCKFNESPCSWNHEYFGSYLQIDACFNKVHSCVQNAHSTTQLWFGVPNHSVKPAY